MPGKIPIKKVHVEKSQKGKSGNLKTFTREIGPKLGPKIRSICLRCRGTKNLCGKARCPILAKYYSLFGGREEKLDTNLLEGNSPPSVFIGRYGYPKVNVGPLTPPEKGDTSILSAPERWFGTEGMDDIIKFRSSLVRGKKKLTDVKIAGGVDRDVERTRYLALSKKPVEAEILFKKKLNRSLSIDYMSPPQGASGEMEKLEVGTVTSHCHVSRVFYDDDLRAEQAVIELYEKGVQVSRIQDLFAVGGTGLKENRRFVPTRWSITAVDDIVGRNLEERIKTNPQIDRYKVYTTSYLDNRWVVVLSPTSWRYELIEAFYPETAWNRSRNAIAIYGDYEGFKGRKTYASLGGCYYAARLGVAEKLRKEGRQAGAIVLREAHPGYILPVGVWVVRESVRNALKAKPKEFDSLDETLKFLSNYLDLALEEWALTSKLLTSRESQKSLDSYLEK